MTSSIFDVIDIEDKIGVTFSNKSVLREAFTHSSYANEKKVKSNENLEFLGDSILNFVIAEYLYQKYPDVKEGELTVLRSNIVSSQPLCDAVQKLNLSEHIFLGAGESKTERNKMNIYADLFEAIVAAIYIDKDMNAARKFVLGNLKEAMTEKKKDISKSDSKTELQELAQRNKDKMRYEQTARTGPDHDPLYTFAVFINDKKIASGSGKSKKEAQQQAAAEALKKIR